MRWESNRSQGPTTEQSTTLRVNITTNRQEPISGKAASRTYGAVCKALQPLAEEPKAPSLYSHQARWRGQVGHPRPHDVVHIEPDARESRRHDQSCNRGQEPAARPGDHLNAADQDTEKRHQELVQPFSLRLGGRFGASASYTLRLLTATSAAQTGDEHTAAPQYARWPQCIERVHPWTQADGLFLALRRNTTSRVRIFDKKRTIQTKCTAASAHSYGRTSDGPLPLLTA